MLAEVDLRCMIVPAGTGAVFELLQWAELNIVAGAGSLA